MLIASSYCSYKDFPPRYLLIPSSPHRPLWVELDSLQVYVGTKEHPKGERGLTCYLPTHRPEWFPKEDCPGELISADPGRSPRPHNHSFPMPSSFFRERVLHYALSNAFAAFEKDGISVERYFLLRNYYCKLLTLPEIPGSEGDQIPRTYIQAGIAGNPYSVANWGDLTSQPDFRRRLSCVDDLIEFNIHYIMRWFSSLIAIFDPPFLSGYPQIDGFSLPDLDTEFVSVYKVPSKFVFFPL